MEELNEENVEILENIKIILWGDTSVGKSNIISRYCFKSFHEDIQSTIGIDFKNVEINVDKKTYDIQIWDTAGQERFRSFLSTYFVGTHGIILVYDITNKNSFDQLNLWIDEIKKSLDITKIKIILVGNKTDLEENRQVQTEVGKGFAIENNFLFLETSAKNDNFINEVFMNLTKEIIKNIKIKSKDDESIAPDFKIDKGGKVEVSKNDENKKFKCC